MTTDDERREVARRLRSLAGGYVTVGEMEDALGICMSSPIVDLERDARDLHRLADLIEPEPERTCRDTSPMSYKFTCSECHSSYRFGSEHKVWYCPYCGAKVIGND